jgi:hypothetical protein
MKHKKLYKTLIASGLVIGCIAVGGYIENRLNRDTEIRIKLKDKDTVIDMLKCQVNNVSFDLEIEKAKLDIIVCESEARHTNIFGDNGKSFGIAQFQKATFNELKIIANRPDLEWKVMKDQLWLLDWALRAGYGKKWSCFKQSTINKK